MLVYVIISSAILCFTFARSEARCAEADEQYNIQFIVDQAAPTPTAYRLLLDFVYQMIETDIAADAKISVISFSLTSSWVYRFSQAQTGRRGVLDAIASASSDYASDNSCYGNGVFDGLADFTENAGITPESANLAFLITDGHPSPGECGHKICEQKRRLDEAGIKLYILGVGPEFQLEYVDCAVDDADRDIITIPNFSDNMPFDRVRRQWREKVCISDDTSDLAFLSDDPVTSSGFVWHYTFHNIYIVVFCVILTLIGICMYLRVCCDASKVNYSRIPDDPVCSV